MKKIIWYADAPCGAGKTFQIVKKICKMCRRGRKVLLSLPTILLADETEKQFRLESDCPHLTSFHSGKVGRGVAKQLADFLNEPRDEPEVVIITHQVLPLLPYLMTAGNWDLIIDECPQADRCQPHNLSDTHAIITEAIEVEPPPTGTKYARIFVSDPEKLREIAFNKNEDEVYGLLQQTARYALSRHYKTFVDYEAYQALCSGTGKSVTFFSLLSHTLVADFRSVFICGANSADSSIYQVWRKRVNWKRDANFEEKLLYRTHGNGHLATIYFALESNWSRKQRHGISDDVPNLIRLRDAAKSLLKSDEPFLWQGNKDVSDALFNEGNRLPNNPLGLNLYFDVHNIVFLSSLNPYPQHCTFLQQQLGLNRDVISRMNYCSTVYQAVMRTSLRKPEDANPKTIIVPDRRAANYLAKMLPGAKLQKLDAGIIEPTGKAGRKRVHSSNAEKSRKQREAKAEQERERLLQSMLGTQDQQFGRGGMRAEKGIDLTTNFDTDPPPWGTMYKTKYSNNPLGYVYCENQDRFVSLLKTSYRRSNSTKETYLFSPAIFDPAQARSDTAGTKPKKRGKENIVYMRSLVLDFDGGDLSPEDFATIFPELECVITNTFQHTQSNPRFRVFIFIDRPISADVYERLWDQIEFRLENAGYYSNPTNPSNFLRSGLDQSKRSATSLFFLPGQAEKSSDSFFEVYKGPGRQPMDSVEWIRVANLKIPEYELTDAPAVQPTPIDQWKVDAAKAIWRSAAPGQGHREFFMLGVRLRGLGMESWQIKTTLQEEVQFARSPDERKREIPDIMKSLAKLKAKSPA